jgi:hypothetical protein
MSKIIVLTDVHCCLALAKGWRIWEKSAFGDFDLWQEDLKPATLTIEAFRRHPVR